MVMDKLVQQLSAIDPQLAELVAGKPWLIALIIIVAIWKLVWYAIALYKSGMRKQKLWFVILFICALFLNDLGILPILYLIFNREKPKSRISKKKK